MGKKKKGKTKKATGGAPKSTPRRPPSKRFSQVNGTTESTSFSLADEARCMSKHHKSAFDSGKKLRHLPVRFVSAGCLEGTIKEQISLPPREPVVPLSSASSASIPTPPASSSQSEAVNAEAMAQMALRSPSPASSEEEVLFTGRGNAENKTQGTAHLSSGPKAPTEKTVSIKSEGLPVRPKAQQPPPVAVKEDSDLDSDVDEVTDSTFKKRRGDKQVWEGYTTPWESRSKPGIGWLPRGQRPSMDAYLRGENEESASNDAAFNDYMQNVKEFGFTAEMMASNGAFHGRDLGLDSDSPNDWSDSDSQQLAEQDSGWNSETLQDLDSLSTSDDVLDEIEQILSKRTRAHGLQYLIVYQGCSTDDAHWLPATFLKTESEKKLIEVFEAKELSRRALNGSLEDSDSSGSYRSEGEDEDYNEGETLDDETIARVLQRQEELGMGGDDIQVFGADDYPHRLSDSITRPSERRRFRYEGPKSKQPGYPSASKMVDVLSKDPYNGFDIMDTERPSLRPRKKGRRGQKPPELEDSDLNEQLQATWEKDRAKKRLRKAEREELRQQGLLGRKGKGADLAVKYKGGVDMQDVVEEIREFMLSDRASLSLPPMEANRRATVHQFVHNLSLTSKSRGGGADRFIVLSKTSRTPRLSDDDFDAALNKKGFKYRLRGSAARGGSFKKGPRTGPAASYKDGDVVGAKAPELSSENKGHMLLSKMGWKKGMALGALDNKGITQPITHTVKTTKAGLQ